MPSPRTVQAAGLLILAACAPAAEPPATSAADSVAVADAIQRYIEVSRANDLAGILATWGDDIWYVNTGSPTMRGRAALDSMVTAVHATMQVTRLDVTTEEVVVSGDLAYARGSYRETLAGAQDTLDLSGRFLHIWRRQPGGEWKLAGGFGTDLPEG